MFHRILLSTVKRCSLLRSFHISIERSSVVEIAEEIKYAIHLNKPTVALESTLLTHGLPAENALEVGRNVEKQIRNDGALPATIAILNKKIRVGLSDNELVQLIDMSQKGFAKKAAIRDIPFALTEAGSKYVFGTTVSATMFAANEAGIRIFSTGGIGGVHKGGQNSLDISSDLTALATIPVAVISAGVKSILDVSRTLEVLESKGVCVASVGTDDFPAFFTPRSGIRSPGRVNSPEEAAELLKISLLLRPNSGMLFAVPISNDLQELGESISRAIQIALLDAEKKNIAGAAITPFLLERVRDLTGDTSLEANIHLVMNNAKFAAKMACAAINHRCHDSKSTTQKDSHVIVIGGSNQDMMIKLIETDIKTTKDIFPPASYSGEIRIIGGGGVGRNIAEVIGRLGVSHSFITAIGKDTPGQFLLDNYSCINWNICPNLPKSVRTANYIGMLNCEGELLYGIADMSIHNEISPKFVEREIKQSGPCKVICADANVTVETLKQIIEVSELNNIPFWFEPTDFKKCTKIIEAKNLTEISCNPITVISPNFSEFKKIYKSFVEKSIDLEFEENDSHNEKLIKNIAQIIRNDLTLLAENWIIKLGREGVIFVNGEESLAFSTPVPDAKDIVSVSGAGDSFVGCVMYLKYVKQWNWKNSLLGGLKVVELSLKSKHTVPRNLHKDMFVDQDELKFWAKSIKIKSNF